MSRASTIVFILALTAATGVAAAGLLSDLSLGDEVYQYRFAKLWFESGHRPVYDPLLETNSRCLYYFDSDPLWAMGLMFLWKMAGGVSRPVMQVYHAAFFGLLIVAVYLLGKQLYDERVGLYAAVIAASMPFLAAYSVVAYIDVPAVMWMTFSFVMLAKRHYLAAGLLAGLAFLTKRNTWLFIPPLGIYLLSLWFRKEISFRSMIVFALPVGLLTITELAGRQLLWGSVFFAPEASEEVASAVLSGQKPVFFPGAAQLAGGLYQAILTRLSRSPSSVPHALEGVNLGGSSSPELVPLTVDVNWNYTPSNILFDPWSIPTYMGVSVLLLVPLYGILRNRKSRDYFLLLPFVIYIMEYLYFFRGQWAVRYLSPVFGLLAVVSALALVEVSSRFSSRRVKYFYAAFLVLCFLQYAGALVKIHAKRQVPQGIGAAYEFIKTAVPADAAILYPEYGLSEETGRRMIWIRLLELPQVFWQLDEEGTKELLAKYKISYIMVKKERVYDDSHLRHRLGYPQSWLDRIHGYRSFQRVFANDDAEILKISSQMGPES